jgi:hypothetical protein
VRFEIFDDTRIYFFVQALFNAKQFAQFKARSELLIDFNDFPQEVETLLHDSLEQRSDVTVIFWEEDDDPLLVFTQNLELLSVDIFKIKFEKPDQEFIQRQAQYRYQKMASELAYKKSMLSEFKKQLQARSPVLVKELEEIMAVEEEFNAKSRISDGVTKDLK